MEVFNEVGEDLYAFLYYHRRSQALILNGKNTPLLQGVFWDGIRTSEVY
jgi:hypothetical protein